MLVIRFFLVSVMVLAMLVYLRGWFQLRASSPNSISALQLGSFMAGVMSVGSAVSPPLAALDHRRRMHMVQHLLMMTIGPPRILLGNPLLSFRMTIELRSLCAGPVSTLDSHSKAGEIFRTLLYSVGSLRRAVLIGWHFPRSFDLAMHSESWHAIECASFLAAGVLFWMPVVLRWPSKAQCPRWSIPVYLFLATLPCDALSAFLTFCGRVVYPHYLHQHRPLSFSALQDQEAAGALMWVLVTFVYLIPAVAATIKILSLSGAYRQQESLKDGDDADGVAVPFVATQLNGAGINTATDPSLLILGRDRREALQFEVSELPVGSRCHDMP